MFQQLQCTFTSHDVHLFTTLQMMYKIPKCTCTVHVSSDEVHYGMYSITGICLCMDLTES